MAYSDYGGLAYRNGTRVLERSDVVITETGIASTPGQWPGWLLAEGRCGGSYHVVLGDGPVLVCLRKQSLSRVLKDGMELFAYGDLGGHIDDGRKITEVTKEFDGYKLRVVHQEEDNCYVYAELTEPSGVVWHGFSGYGVGAGFEDGGYGFSNEDRVDSMWELFGRWEENNGIGRSL